MTGIVFTLSSMISKLIQEMLKDFCNIDIALSKDDLLNLLTQKNYQFLIIDRTLKEVSAKEIVGEIIIKLKNNNLPIVLLTQDRYNPAEDGTGFSFILRKPFSKDQLIEVVKFVIEEKEKKCIENVLIVDDSKTSRSILRKILNKNNINCIEADNGKSGINLALKYKPDLIITDYHMHDISGIELAKKLSKIEILKFIPVILITGTKNINAVMEEGFDSGIAAYFSKPYKENQIINFFNKYMDCKNSTKILILDDSLLKRKAIYSGLQVITNKIITTDNIATATSLLEDNTFDLILLDLILNNENAIDALKNFRQISKDIPIIVYSSIGERQNVYSILEAGASDFLWSPIEMRELILKTKIWAKYSRLQKLEEKIEKLNIGEKDTNTYSELVDFMMNTDKLKNRSGVLVCIKNLSKDDVNKINKNLRKNTNVHEYEGSYYFYLSDTSLKDAISVCYRIFQHVKNRNITFGISTINEVNTVEELFSKAYKSEFKLT